jgi:hypothetical protein
MLTAYLTAASLILFARDSLPDINTNNFRNTSMNFQEFKHILVNDELSFNICTFSYEAILPSLQNIEGVI